MMSLELWQIILLSALVTYFTRTSGYVILTRFKTLPPRLEAALEAVPAAVLSTLVVPPALTKGPAEAITMLLAVFLCLRLPPIIVLFISLAVLVAARHLGL